MSTVALSSYWAGICWFLWCYGYMSDDDDLRVDMRKLAPAQQEALRMRVMGAINDGMPPAEAVRVFGVRWDSIHNWRRQETDGTQGLCSGRPSRKPEVASVWWTPVSWDFTRFQPVQRSHFGSAQCGDVHTRPG